MAAAGSSDGLRKFFVDALTVALDLGLAVPEDVLKHVTPDVLAAHLPRPLWGKLLGACLAAAKTDARLVVDTIGVPALAEHVPGAILWSVVADVANRALGKGLVAAPPPPAVTAAPPAPVVSTPAPAPAPAPAPTAVPTPVATTKSAPVPVPVPATPSGPTAVPTLPSMPASRNTGPIPAVKLPTPTPQPAAMAAAARAATSNTTSTTATPAPPSAVVDIDFDDEEPEPLEAPPVSPHRATTVPGPSARGTPPTPSGGARPSGAGASSRRPQASAAKPAGRNMPPSPRRAATANADFDLDTDVGGGDKPVEIPVDDDLIDWATSEETVTSGDNPLRKR